MVASKRAAADPTKSSNENKRTCIGEGGTTGSLISDELCWDNQGIRTEMGAEFDLSRSVVALALSDGHKVLFASSGVAIERRRNVTKFVTVASLVRALQQSHSNVKIEVHYEGKVVIGVLEEYDLAHGIAFVKATTTLDVYCVSLNHAVEFMPETKVVAVARDISGKVMSTSGKLRCSDGCDNGEAGDYPIMLSTYKLSEGWQGGACFDYDGNIVGINLLFDMERPVNLIILPRSTIFERWENLRTSSQRNKGRRTKGVKLYSGSQAYEDVPSKAQSENGSRDYPHSTLRDKNNRRIALLNANHGPFGDAYPDGVWGEFNGSSSLFLSKNVVALASFNGGTKFFSCTGFFVNFDDECQTILTSATLVREPDGSSKIVEGLRIKVLLPNNQSKEGELKHCSLQYNVALVSVKNCRYVRHLNLEQCSVIPSSKMVVAVGRSFESGALMATRGKRTCWSGPFDCDCLAYSSCKISKVGVGGPLVDIDGNFVGMNYYDKKMGTPFLYFDDLSGILQYFKTKQTKYLSMLHSVRNILEDNEFPKNRWKLPDPSGMGENEREEERMVRASLDITSRCKYAYTNGHVAALK